MYLYFNNLKALPNFGCRTTGMALEQLIEKNNDIKRYDAMESVNFSGAWDVYARGPLKHGGIIPRRIYEHAWRNRAFMPRIYKIISRIDHISGAEHDYISKNPHKSVAQYKRFSIKNPRISPLLDEIDKADGVIINGEGTLIFSNPTLRDALYLLFIIALAQDRNKPVYLLNAMIAPCPYSGEDLEVLNYALPLLAYCKVIAVRESTSFHYLSTKIGSSNLEIIPDALFTWGEKIRNCISLIRSEPSIGSAYPELEDFSRFSFTKPYICVSGSSSAWRHEPEIWHQFPKLISALLKKGYPVYCIETCDGDYFLAEAAKKCGANFIPRSTPVLAAAGMIAGSLIYITGRYHPAIMASASGTPCIFLSSNSHKTSSIQTLLGYERQIEYSICPDDRHIKQILKHADELIAKRSEISDQILKNFKTQSQLASRYSTILNNSNSIN